MAHTSPAAGRFAQTALAVLLTLLLLLTVAVPAVSAEGPDEQQQRARAIARDLQCPICENNSILDSPSELATQMREIVSEQVAAGKSREEIVRYFVDRYGEGVLREPPKEGFTLLVWIGPLIAIAIAGAVVAGVLRNRTARPAFAAPDTDTEIPLAPDEAARYTALVEQEVARLEEGRR